MTKEKYRTENKPEAEQNKERMQRVQEEAREQAQDHRMKTHNWFKCTGMINK